jgi:hypothetical protein
MAALAGGDARSRIDGGRVVEMAQIIQQVLI